MAGNKKRLISDITGEKGVTFIKSFCDEYNFLFQGEPRKDYGIDCYIEAVLKNRPTNFIIGVQSKSGESYQRGETTEGFYIYFDEADIAYWLASNIPVFVSFFDEQERKLYFKHVQQYCSQVQLPVNEVKKIYFDKVADQANATMAEYIRRLVTSTPTEINRLGIISCKIPKIVLPNESVDLSCNQLGHAIRTSVNIYDYFKPSENNYEFNFKGESFILGYSEDLEWVSRISVVDLGSKCSTFGITFLNLKKWSSLYLPIYEEADEDEGGIKKDEMIKRLDKIQGVINKLTIKPAWQLYQEYRYYDNVQPEISFCFGDEQFDVSISQMINRAALILTANKYIPPRITSISIERKMTSMILLNEDEMIEFNKPKGYKSIGEISIDESASLLTIGILTNEEHGCWGNPEVQHIYLTFDEIKKYCLQALQG